MAEVKIDKGVPMPVGAGASGLTVWPFRQMEPGDSFFAPGYCVNGRGAKSTDRKALNTQNFRKKIPGSKWAVRTITENGIVGVRVWRVA